MENRLILITITGQDRPGVIAKVAQLIADTDGARIRDIEQTTTHTQMVLTLLLDLSAGGSSEKPLIKDLLFQAKEMGLDLDFAVISEDDYQRKTAGNTYVVTILGSRVDARSLAEVTALLAEASANVVRISKLTQRELRCVELLINTDGQLDVPALKRQLLQVGGGQRVDVAVQKESLYRRAKRLVVMDMDSTLIQVEVIDELARLAGVGDDVARITEQAMNGELDFGQSLAARVALLKGLKEEALDEVYRSIPFTPGARNLVHILKRLGFRTAVISGGFKFFTDRLQQELGLDYAFANQLEIVNGEVTGRTLGRIVDGECKAQLLEEIAEREGVTLDQVIAIGDGANDLPMLGKAGLGIAFNAKARVREQADTHINQQSLDSILYLLGLSEREVDEISA
ncbi:phosphoserine phosphatase SerB [uncultured Desulfuromonas sp.]|uniref:phosphoserine phosphatase SerB n=1 Tax=uncultured Desulfuromonas sp. TaxID=181013 RepID=UPI002AAA6752|nr:phosphoserine phosphatase SerB [uncultured Desulfuromonas sp.]